ncbi:hypothetical protein AVEN_136281-1 [Araneus ventricosus]|uniref:Uncharacterized protein n=1 Tax=Araneus ventricosus TaxID=182803 RepID=A0A4Y2RZD8_ARAVE|nr:hypothetical protein AVEN_136281-1 [Araneus ventricosus]
MGSVDYALLLFAGVRCRCTSSCHDKQYPRKIKLAQVYMTIMAVASIMEWFYNDPRQSVQPVSGGGNSFRTYIPTRKYLLPIPVGFSSPYLRCPLRWE